MSGDEEPDAQSAYWNDRFKHHSHTGWNVPQIYAHDQKIRVRAILSALDSLGVESGSGLRVLDIGCGTGDITNALAGRDMQVVGYDISSGVIELARDRFRDVPNVQLECANLVDTDIEHGPFDLITSVTVLQHQVDDEALDTLIGNLTRALKPGGRIVILETVLPDGSAGNGTGQYIRPRTRSEWLTHFRRAGCELAYERSYPQAAVTTLAWVRAALRRVSPRPAQPAPIPAATTSAGTTAAQPPPSLGGRARRRAVNLGLKGFLAVFVPFDHWLRIPTPRAIGSARIMAFTQAEPGENSR